MAHSSKRRVRPANDRGRKISVFSFYVGEAKAVPPVFSSSLHHKSVFSLLPTSIVNFVLNRFCHFAHCKVTLPRHLYYILIKSYKKVEKTVVICQTRCYNTFEYNIFARVRYCINAVTRCDLEQIRYGYKPAESRYMEKNIRIFM